MYILYIPYITYAILYYMIYMYIPYLTCYPNDYSLHIYIFNFFLVLLYFTKKTYLVFSSLFLETQL